MLQAEAYCLMMFIGYSASEAAVIVVHESKVPTNLRQYTAEKVWFALLN
jgi:hypothetical protein